VRSESDHHCVFIGEVVIDGGAADVGRCGELGHGDGVEAVLCHQAGERFEDASLYLLAVLLHGRSADLGHAATLTPT